MNQTASLADLNKKTNTKEACEEKREEKCSMKKSLKSLLAVCLAAAMAVTATGCGGSSAPASGGSSTESGAAGGEAAAGEEKLSSRDTLNMACKSEPTSLDPAQTKDLVTGHLCTMYLTPCFILTGKPRNMNQQLLLNGLLVMMVWNIHLPFVMA